jgi:hypothetical protein
MELGHLLTRSGLTCPEVSSKVCHESFCQSGCSVSLSWVVYYEALCLHVVSSFSCVIHHELLPCDIEQGILSEDDEKAMRGSEVKKA